MNYEFVYDFKANKHLNAELNQLIKRSYSRSTLDDWMLKGHPDSNYQYFGLVDLKGTLVAAVGLIKTSMFFHNKKHSAIQIGNVFFRELGNFSVFEKRDMEHFLLEKVVSKFNTIVDLIYYYHNDDEAEPLLSDFGLQKFQEHKYYLDLAPGPRKNSVLKRVNLDNHLDNEELSSMIKHSYQVSKNKFDIANDSVIKMYNILKHYRRNVYKIPSLDVTGVFEVKDDVFKIIATFSKQEVNLEEVIKAVVPEGIKRVEFGFTPGSPIEGLKTELVPESTYKENDLASSHLYVKKITLDLDDEVMFPLLSRQK